MKYTENNGWEKIIGNDQMYLTQKYSLHCFPTIKVLVDNDLCFTVSIHGWHLPDDHERYEKYFRSMSNILISQLLDGISETESYMLHVVPQEATTECEQPEPKVFKRSSKCFLLAMAHNLCQSCNSLLKRVEKKQK